MAEGQCHQIFSGGDVTFYMMSPKFKNGNGEMKLIVQTDKKFLVVRLNRHMTHIDDSSINYVTHLQSSTI